MSLQQIVFTSNKCWTDDGCDDDSCNGSNRRDTHTAVCVAFITLVASSWQRVSVCFACDVACLRTSMRVHLRGSDATTIDVNHTNDRSHSTTNRTITVRLRE